MLNNQTASPLIQVNALTKRYGDGENILENVNFNIQKTNSSALSVIQAAVNPPS